MNRSCSVGFYYNCYKNKNATDKILEQLRKIYPSEPVFLLSDKGDDFGDIASKYNCFYKYSDIQILGGRIVNGVNHMCFTDEICAKHYLKMIKTALEICNTDYLVFMEDDVFIHNIITHFPEHSGGNFSKNLYSDQLKPEYKNIIKETYPNLQFDYWNMAGGSIIHSATLLECINNTSFDEIKRFDKLTLTSFELWHTNDILISYLLMINGKTNDLQWTNTSKSNISHPDKRFYTQNLTIEQGVYRK